MCIGRVLEGEVHMLERASPSLVLLPPRPTRLVSEREGWLLTVAALFIINMSVSILNLAALYTVLI